MKNNVEKAKPGKRSITKLMRTLPGLRFCIFKFSKISYFAGPAKANQWRYIKKGDPRFIPRESDRHGEPADELERKTMWVSLRSESSICRPVILIR